MFKKLELRWTKHIPIIICDVIILFLSHFNVFLLQLFG